MGKGRRCRVGRGVVGGYTGRGGGAVTTAAVRELVLLKLRQCNSLWEAHGLQSLDFTKEIRRQTRDEAAEQNRRSQSNHFVGETFKIGQVIINGAALMEFEQSTVRVVVIGGGKTRLHRLKHGLLGCQETIPRHPLKPAQRRALHVKRGHGETLRIGDTLIVKELLDFKNPSERVLSIESGHLKLHIGARVVEWRLGGRRFGGGWVCSEGGKTVKNGVEYVCYGDRR